MLKRVLLFAVILIVYSCSGTEETAARTCSPLSLKTTSVTDSIQYDIILAVLREFHTSISTNYMSQQTQQSQEAQFLDYDIQDFLTNPDTILINAYNLKNVEPLNWANDFSGLVKLINQDEIFCVLTFGWTDFNARFIGANGFLQFGQPTYNSEGQALLEYSFYCGEKCGNGFVVLLQQDTNGWRIVERNVSWQA